MLGWVHIALRSLNNFLCADFLCLSSVGARKETSGTFYRVPEVSLEFLSFPPFSISSSLKPHRDNNISSHWQLSLLSIAHCFATQLNSTSTKLHKNLKTVSMRLSSWVPWVSTLSTFSTQLTHIFSSPFFTAATPHNIMAFSWQTRSSEGCSETESDVFISLTFSLCESFAANIQVIRSMSCC